MLLRIDNKYVCICYMDKFAAACVSLNVSRVWSMSIIVQTYACTCLEYCCAADACSIIFHSAITMFCMPISVHRMCMHFWHAVQFCVEVNLYRYKNVIFLSSFIILNVPFI